MDSDKLNQIVQHIEPGLVLLGTSKLTGGLSADVCVIEVLTLDKKKKKFVLRIYGEEDFRLNTSIASYEHKLLEILKTKGILAPKSAYYDESQTICARPYIIVEYIDGEVILDPTDKYLFAEQLATMLAKIHSINSKDNDLTFLQKQADNVKKMLNGSQPTIKLFDVTKIHNKLTNLQPIQTNNSVILHGDYWPGNILWEDEVLKAVIDWSDSAYGDPLADVANARFEIMLTLGQEAMQTFTDRYKKLMPHLDYQNLNYWDLFAVYRIGPIIDTWNLDHVTKKMVISNLNQFIIENTFS